MTGRVVFVYGPRGHVQLVATEHEPGYAEQLQAWKEPQGCRVEVLSMDEYRALRHPGGAPAPAESASPAVLPVTQAPTLTKWPNRHPGPHTVWPDAYGEGYEQVVALERYYPWHDAFRLAVFVATDKGLGLKLLFPDREKAEEGRYPLVVPAHDLLSCRPLRHWAALRKVQWAEFVERQAEREADWQWQIRRCPTPSAFGLANLPWIDEEINHPVVGPCRVTHMLFFEKGAPDVAAPECHEDYWRPVAIGPRGSGLVFPGKWKPLEQPAPAPAAADGEALAQEFGAQKHDPAQLAPAVPADPAPKPSHMPSLFG